MNGTRVSFRFKFTMKFKNPLNRLRLSIVVLAAAFANSAAHAETALPFSKRVAVVAGQGLYQQSGANSCSYCHGMTGAGGSVAAAAKLNQPKTWKSWKALGGDAAFNKDKATFLKNLEDAIVILIQKGAISFNSTYKKAHYDLKLAGGSVNGQMLGVSGAPSKRWIKKYAERGINDEVAARVVYMHLQSFDTQSVFKQ